MNRTCLLYITIFSIGSDQQHYRIILVLGEFFFLALLSFINYQNMHYQEICIIRQGDLTPFWEITECVYVF